MYKPRNLIPLGLSVLSDILRVKSREVPNCELLSVARAFESEMLAWMVSYDKGGLEA